MRYTSWLMSILALACIVVTLAAQFRGQELPAAPAWLVAGVLMMMVDGIRGLQNRVSELERQLEAARRGVGDETAPPGGTLAARKQ